MAIPRILNPEQIRQVALSYFCGVNIEPLKEKFGVSDETIKHNVVKKYSRELNDPLIEFYRGTPPLERIRNAAHLYLAHNGKPVPKAELVELRRDSGVYHWVREEVYVPKINAITIEISLDTYIQPDETLLQANKWVERLLAKIVPRDSHQIIESILLDTLYEAYQSEELSRWELVYDQVKTSLVSKIKSGGLALTPKKEEMVYKVLQTLSEREQKVLESRFEPSGKVRSLEEVAPEFNVSPERIRQIEAKAFRKLMHSSRRQKLELAYSLATDAEIESIVATQKVQEEEITWRKRLYSSIEEEVLGRAAREPSLFEKITRMREARVGEIKFKTIYELELSVRTFNCLESATIKTVGELCEKTEADLLKCKNFGRRSLKEIKEVLKEMGLCLKESEGNYSGT